MTLLAVVAWLAVAATAVVLLTQLIGWSGNGLVVTAQAATPYLLALSVPIAVAAAVTDRWALAAAAGIVVAALVKLCWPVQSPPRQQPAPAGARPLRVFHGNVLYKNERTIGLAAVVSDLEADVLAFTEYTPDHARSLHASPVAESFPYRIERPDTGVGGAAIWSRHPLTEIPAPPARYRSIAAVIEADDAMTLYVVHPPNPLHDLGDWRDEIAGFTALGSASDAPAADGR